MGWLLGAFWKSESSSSPSYNSVARAPKVSLSSGQSCSKPLAFFSSLVLLYPLSQSVHSPKPWASSLHQTHLASLLASSWPHWPSLKKAVGFTLNIGITDLSLAFTFRKGDVSFFFFFWRGSQIYSLWLKATWLASSNTFLGSTQTRFYLVSSHLSPVFLLLGYFLSPSSISSFCEAVCWSQNFAKTSSHDLYNFTTLLV